MFASTDCPTLLDIINQHPGHIELTHPNNHVPSQIDSGKLSAVELLACYHEVFPQLEQLVWNDGFQPALLQQLQALFREYESHYKLAASDERFNFIIVIPVADRPLHLRHCLHSLYELCEHFQYGGKNEHGHYRKVRVIIADDSSDEINIRQHQELAHHYSNQGLECEHFGQAAQLETLRQFSSQQDRDLSRILGTHDDTSFSHKGASVMRNITYLKLKEFTGRHEKYLFYFIDSDQEFKLPVYHQDKYQQAYCLNYFWHLDRIFSKGKCELLTGKVVGDPPVSPAVMAANLLQDVNHVLAQLSQHEPNASCQFHQEKQVRTEQAAYHDMADKFGFNTAAVAHVYNCPLPLPHDHKDCLRALASRLGQFFDGVHPTRSTPFTYQAPQDNLAHARTVYTGNYVLSANALQYFIPFASSRWRMAGPTLGRILQALIDDRFCTANLPMHHRRTTHETGESEYRAGIKRQEMNIDLSNEYQRQFYGDIMLFSMEELVKHGYPLNRLDQSAARQILENTSNTMLAIYQEKLQLVDERLQQLGDLIENNELWWTHNQDMQDTLEQLRQFCINIRNNFHTDGTAWQQIMDEDNHRECINNMLDEIMHYPEDLANWQRLLSRH